MGYLNPTNGDSAELAARLDRLALHCQPRRTSWAELRQRLPVQRPPGRRWGRGRRWTAAAAAVAVAASIGLVWLGAVALRQGPERDTGAELSWVLVDGLADGVAVWLTGDTKLHVVDPRRVRLEEGEVHVAVDRAQAGADPFWVETPAGDAKATGTQFRVDTIPLNSETIEPPQPKGARAMNVRFLTRVLVLAGVVQLATGDLSIVGRAGDVLAAEGKGGKQSPSVQPHIYCLYAVQAPRVRARLELTEAQDGKVDVILAEYRKSWNDFVDEKRRMEDEVLQKTFEVLSDEQKKTLKGLDSVAGMWLTAAQWPGIAEQIGLDNAESKQLEAIFAEHVQKRSQAFRSVQNRSRTEMVTQANHVKGQYQQMVKDAKDSLRKVLSDQQFDTLITEIAKTQWPAIFQQGRYQEEIAWSEGQAEVLNTILKQGGNKEEVAKLKKTRDERREKAYNMLTDRQKEQLKQTRTVSGMWFTAIQWPGMCEKIRLDRAQCAKVQAIIAQHQKERSQAFASVQKRSPDETVAKSREVQKEYRQLIADTKAAVRDLLSERQFDALITVIAKKQLPCFAQQGRFAEELQLSKDQKQKIQTLTEELQKQTAERAANMWKERKQLDQQLRKVLTAEQETKLKAATSGRGTRSPGLNAD